MSKKKNGVTWEGEGYLFHDVGDGVEEDVGALQAVPDQPQHHLPTLRVRISYIRNMVRAYAYRYR
jgi:hypothetical protein